MANLLFFINFAYNNHNKYTMFTLSQIEGQVHVEVEKIAEAIEKIVIRKMSMTEDFELVDFLEPAKDTPTGAKLFPDVHEGNMRRLIRHVLTAPEWADIKICDRLWMMAAVLIELGLANNNMRGIRPLAMYVELILGIDISYYHQRVDQYWRDNYPNTWHPGKKIGNPPSNADHVLDFANWVKHCATKGKHIDDRLWAKRPQRP